MGEDSDITTQDLTAVTPEQLAQELAGPGVTVSNVSYTGQAESSGLFAGGLAPIGFEDGVLLTSGAAADVIGPNESDSTSVDTDGAGDSQLSDLSGNQTYNASVLEFDFVPNGSHIQFQYTFASEEYNEYVFSQYNDVFAFYVNGANCALTSSGAPVAVNTINNGHDFDGVNAQNPDLFRNNDLDNGGGAIRTEMDGLTVVMTCAASVQSGQANHMKLAIADASDPVLDSAVFIKAKSLTTMTCAEDGLASLQSEDIASGTVHDAEPGVDEFGSALSVPGLGSVVHDINCNLIVPVEDAVDNLVVEVERQVGAGGTQVQDLATTGERALNDSLALGAQATENTVVAVAAVVANISGVLATLSFGF